MWMAVAFLGVGTGKTVFCGRCSRSRVTALQPSSPEGASCVLERYGVANAQRGCKRSRLLVE